MDATNASSTDRQSSVGAADQDEPYRFGRRPTARAPFPFTVRQFARLLIVRGRIQAASADTDPGQA